MRPEAAAPTAWWKPGVSRSSALWITLLIAIIALTAALAAIVAGWSGANDTARREAFEHVLGMSDEQLRGKSALELRELRSAVRNAYWSSGYSRTLMDREFDQIDALIIGKTAG